MGEPKDDKGPPGSGVLGGSPPSSGDAPDPSRVTPSQQRPPFDADACAQGIVEKARVDGEERARRDSQRRGRR